MREDFMDALDRMFPNGYVIVWPTDDLQHVRTSIFGPERMNAQPSDHALRDAYRLLQGEDAPECPEDDSTSSTE